MDLDYLGPYSGKGTLGDPDMLQVGNGWLNLEEAKTHFSIWAMWSAPLIAGNDATKMNGSDIASKVLLNTEVIAIDQDPKNNWAARVKTTARCRLQEDACSGRHVRDRAGQPDDSAASITVNWSDIGLVYRHGDARFVGTHDITPSGSGYTATPFPRHGRSC